VRRALYRALLAGALLLALAPVGCGSLYNTLGGSFRGHPAQLSEGIRSGAQALIDAAYDGIDPDAWADYHVHLLTREVNPRARQWWNVISYGRFRVYLSASGVRWSQTLEEDYVARLLDLVQGMPQPGRF
jgi:hypothetical protein